MNENIVLDASALLALIQNEAGADVVRPLLKKAIMSAINVAEVLTALLKVDIFPEDAAIAVSDIIHKIVPFDLEQARHTSELYPYVKHKGLSLGDRACIGLGQKLQLPVYTADKIWAELKLENVEICLIR